MTNKIQDIIKASKFLIKDDASLSYTKTVVGKHNLEAIRYIKNAFQEIKQLNEKINGANIQTELFIRSVYEDVLLKKTNTPDIKSKKEGGIFFLVPNQRLIDRTEKEMDEGIESAIEKSKADKKYLLTLEDRIKNLENFNLESILKNNLLSFVSNKTNGRSKIRDEISNIGKEIEGFLHNMFKATDDGREAEYFYGLVDFGFSQYRPSNIAKIVNISAKDEKNSIRIYITLSNESLKKGNVLGH